jgi:hypothetical protein
MVSISDNNINTEWNVYPSVVEQYSMLVDYQVCLVVDLRFGTHQKTTNLQPLSIIGENRKIMLH